MLELEFIVMRHCNKPRPSGLLKANDVRELLVEYLSRIIPPAGTNQKFHSIRGYTSFGARHNCTSVNKRGCGTEIHIRLDLTVGGVYDGEERLAVS